MILAPFYRGAAQVLAGNRALRLCVQTDAETFVMSDVRVVTTNEDKTSIGNWHIEYPDKNGHWCALNPNKVSHAFYSDV